MKKILLFICLGSVACKKSYLTDRQDFGVITFTAGSQAVSYSGLINQTNQSGVAIEENKVSPMEWIYFIFGGKSEKDNFFIDLVSVNALAGGPVDAKNITHVSYKKGDSLYLFNGRDSFSVIINTYSNKILNGSFGGVLRTSSGTTINISDGKLKNVPATN